ncbi:hypothetical protein AB0J42_13055 [Nonomuraea sp. NPDC049649]|uniref:hypothetical protein n=1 Tax=Nonomuraea sp. NPDC049649 TaxID=3155776 RepID=UPI00341FCF6D
MNPIMTCTPEVLHQRDVAVKLVRLRDLLVDLGVPAELHDNDSSLMVPRPHGGLPVWVTVDGRGEVYIWGDGERHPAIDPKSLAGALRELVRTPRISTPRVGG